MIDDEDRAPVVAHFGDQRRERRGLARRQPREGLVDEHDLGIAGDGLGDLHFAQIGERQRGGAPIQYAGQSDTLGDRARSRFDRRAGKETQQSIGQKPEHDVLDDRLPVQRTRMLEHHADAEPRYAVRRPARDLDAVDANRSGVGPLDPRIDFITVDLPDPFGPIRPRISPA